MKLAARITLALAVLAVAGTALACGEEKVQTTEQQQAKPAVAAAKKAPAATKAAPASPATKPATATN